MKDKKMLTYILIAASIGVWGLVFYKIFAYVGGGDEVPLGTNTVTSVPSAIEKEETYNLLANYRDPFLGNWNISLGGVNSNNIGSVKRKGIPKVKEPEKPIDISFISFSGLITNPTTRKKVALVTVKGKQAMVSEGEILDDVKFIKNFKDSIQISYMGKMAYVKRF